MKFSSQPIPEHAEVPLADEGQLEQIVSHWQEQSDPLETTPEENAVYVLSVGKERDPKIRAAQLAEIVELVEAQGDHVVGQEICYLNKPQPRTLLGKGTSRDIAERARAAGANLLVLDAELTPSQTRNLEDVAGIPICDREAVILNVFLRHASTRRARVQVEIARLEYLRPRIRGVGINMDQQMGGVAGSRGPGETASELMARQLDNRLVELKKVQARVQRCGEQQRRGRELCQRLVMVGYTNAGKTSLMNALTDETLSSRDRPFETLDTVSRSLSRHGEEVLLSDTVGFIRRLPDRLLASFETTLAEACEANLLLIVTDLSDYEWREHIQTTTNMLEKLAADAIPRLYIFNKIDLLQECVEDEELSEICGESPYTRVSSLNPAHMSRLKDQLLELVRKEQRTLKLYVPYSSEEVMTLIYGGCRVIHTRTCPNGLRLVIQGPPHVVAKVEEANRCLHQ